MGETPRRRALLLECDIGVVGRLDCGSIEDRLLPEVGGGGLLVDGFRCFVYPFRPYLGTGFSIRCGGRSTEEGGELPGVLAKVLANDRSPDMMLEIDSRKCAFCLELTGSSRLSRS